MRSAPKLPLPWDIAVFLTVASVGLGLSVQSFIQQDADARIRLPASVDTKPITQPASETIATQTIDLGCLEHHQRSKRFRSESGALRFRGRFCQIPRRAMKRFDGAWIRNVTNGYEGTIIFRGDDDASFVTDYLVLQSGENSIQIEWRPQPGAPMQKILAEVRETR